MASTNFSLTVKPPPKLEHEKLGPETTSAQSQGLLKQATGIKATTGSVTPSQLAQTQLNNILKDDSPLMKRARTQGMQYAASRGLLNTSMAGEAATGAMIDRATPIAQQDASTYQTQALENQRAKNTFGLANKDIYGQMAGQKDQQRFQAVENVKDRNLRRDEQGAQFEFDAGQTEADLANQRWLQENRQVWQSGENVLDRSFTTSERESSQGYQTSERLGSQEFQTGERLGSQQFQTGEREATQQFQGRESQLDRALTTSENGLDRALQQALQSQDQSWRTGESAQDRALQERLQLLDQAFRGEQSAIDRLLQEKLQQNDQSWRTGENELDRVLQGRLQELQQTFQGDQAAMDRALQQSLQESDQRFRGDQSGLDREFQSGMQKAEQEWKTSETALDRVLQERLQSQDQSWRTGENELDRALQGRLQELDQEFRGDQAGMDRALQQNMQKYDQEWKSSESSLDRQQQEFLQDKDQNWRSNEASVERQFQAQQNDLQRTATTDAQMREIEANYRQQAAGIAADLQKLGYAFELDNYKISGDRAYNAMLAMQEGATNILMQPEMDAAAKKSALDNLYDVTNSSLEFLSNLTRTPIPGAATPEGTPFMHSPMDGGQGLLQPQQPQYDLPATPAITQAQQAQLSGMVTKAYQDSLGRIPDPDGLTFWTQQAARNNWSQDQLNAAIRQGAGDYVQQYGQPQFDQYGNVVGHQ